MNIRNFITGKNAFIVVSTMLAAYLLLILTVINLGQNKLKEAKHKELQFQVEHYAESLSNYFSNTQRKVNTVANDKAISTFFSNKTSGMSRAYGLGASLFNVKKLLKNLTSNNDQSNPLLFSRMSLLTLNGTIIADSKDKSTFSSEHVDILTLKQQQQKILIDDSQTPLSIRISTTIYLHKKPIALLISELNTSTIIEQLNSPEYQTNSSRIELSSSDGQLLAWDSLASLHKESYTHKNSERRNLYFLQEDIKSSPFVLKAWFENQNRHDLFTSKWFALAISLLAIPVFLGIYYLIHTERKNILLQSEISNSKKQREVLSLHNIKLEEEISKRKLSEEKLAYQATHDTLTGLANRSYSLQRLSYAIDCCQRSHNKVLILYIDLDNFKQINDTLGHAAGDIILQQTSERLANAVRKTDTVARLSGDEFMLIIPDLEDQQQATGLAVKILSLFDQPFEMDEHPFHTSTSIGLALYPDDGDDPATLLKSADMALYRVKDTGRNNFSFYETKMNDELKRKVAINRRLREAIKNNTLEMYYQPLVDLNTKKIIGAEALMRWIDEELGFVPPDEFIALAEKNDLIGQLGSFALNQAAQQAAEWQAITPLQIAVNFSSVQFRDCEALLKEIQQVLKITGLPAEKLDVEVTESLLINQENELFEMLETLRAMEIQLSIDDFGTGYSALSYLKKFSFTKLKIDRAFVMNLNESSADQSLVRAIVAMAKALNLKIVAEGIEEKEQMQFLENLNCEYGQGYLFSKPVTASEFEKLLYAQQENT